jgi:hypothetical protein
MRVLVVDDDDLVRTVAVDTLRHSVAVRVNKTAP